jgi:hypothetical protein
MAIESGGPRLSLGDVTARVPYNWSYFTDLRNTFDKVTRVWDLAPFRCKQTCQP